MVRLPGGHVDDVKKFTLLVQTLKNSLIYSEVADPNVLVSNSFIR